MQPGIYRCFSSNTVVEYPTTQAKFYSNLEGTDGFIVVAGGTPEERTKALAHLRESVVGTEFNDVPFYDEADMGIAKKIAFSGN